jgi:hypothetical protein
VRKEKQGFCPPISRMDFSEFSSKCGEVYYPKWGNILFTTVPSDTQKSMLGNGTAFFSSASYCVRIQWQDQQASRSTAATLSEIMGTGGVAQ